MLQVIWSKKAKESFKDIIEQIERDWSFKEASIFVKKTNRIILLISQHPYIYQETNLPNVRKAIISKQTSLLYKVNNQKLEILFFWDNRQQPIF